MRKLETLRRFGRRSGAAGREERKGGEQGGNPKSEGRSPKEGRRAEIRRREGGTKHPTSNIQHPTSKWSQSGSHRTTEVRGGMGGVSWVHWNRSFSAGVGTAASRGEIRSPKAEVRKKTEGPKTEDAGGLSMAQDKKE